jgi:hypothetical protein
MDVTARADEEHHNRSDDQQNPGDDEGFQIGAECDPENASQVGRRGTADLMDDGNPRYHDPDPFGADNAN